MPTFHAISKTQHANQRYLRYTRYDFAANDAVAPLVLQELNKACMHLPVVFIVQGTGFSPVVLQGFEAGKNLLVDPKGQWRGGYVPAAYRSHPFALLPNEANELVLCINADSRLLSDSAGEPFFDEQGQPTQAIRDTLIFLQKVHHNRLATQTVCELLAHHQLIQPWPLKVQTENGEQTIEGLFRIDEPSLQRLDGAALQTLQSSGALQAAYMQLLSMQHLDKLVALAKAHAEYAQTQAQALSVDAKGELDLEFLSQGGTLNLSVL